LGQQDLPVRALHGVDEAVARGVRHELARLAVDLAVDQDVGADLVVVPHVIGRVLEVPVHVAGVGIVGDRAVGEQVVTWPMGRIELWDRVARAPDGLIGLRIVGAGDPDRAAAGLPGVGLVLPGLTAGLTRARDGVFAPDKFSARGIERGDPVTDAGAARRRTHQDLVLDRKRRARDAQRRIVGDVGLPNDFAGLLIG